MASVEAAQVQSSQAPTRRAGIGIMRVFRRLAREWQLVALCAVALGARLWGLAFGLPYAIHPDEPVVYGTVVHMIHDHTANPGTFIYPSALYYFFALIGIVYELVTGATLGSPPDGTGIGLYTTPDAVFCMRLGVALIGVAAIAIVYLAARRMVGTWPAVAGALLLALSPLHINLTQIATTDGPSATGLVLTAALCVLAVRTDNPKVFWLAGLALGLAIGTKYNVAAGGAMLLAAYGVVLWRRRRAEGGLRWRSVWRDPRLLGFALIPVAFLITTPFALIHPHVFYHDVGSVVLHYDVKGHLGTTGSSLQFALNEMFAHFEVLLSVLAVIGVISVIVRRRVEMAIIAVGALAYFVVVAVPKVHFERNLIPLWPLLAILAAEGVGALALLLGRLIERVSFAPAAHYRFVIGGVLLVVLAVAFVPSLGRTVELDTIRSSTDVRVTASQWINSDLSAGTSIAIEPYSVTLTPDKFHVAYLSTGLYTEPLSWFPAHHIQYVVASGLFYSRFFVDGAPYPTERSDYTTMLTQWRVVKTFTGPDLMDGVPGGTITLLQVTS